MTRVQFHALAAGGDAVGRDEAGRTIFTPFAAPNDKADVRVIEEHAKFARAELVQLVTPSELRTAPPCPYFGPNSVLPCGGCQWQHVAYATQLDNKRSFVIEALRRIGGVDHADTLVAECIPSPNEYSYRNKADLVVSGTKATAQLGFFARESHQLVAITHCPIQQHPNELVLKAAYQALQADLVEGFNAETGKGILRRLVVRTSARGDVLAIAVTTSQKWPQAKAFAQLLMEHVPSLVGVLRREPRTHAQLLAGRDWLEEDVDDLRLRVSGDGFFQVNTALTPALLQTALRFADVQPGQHALDLFCGVGLFSLGLARAGACVTGIEQNGRAVADARSNAQLNGCEADFLIGDAAETLRRYRKQNANRVDVVLLDPPRAGASQCLDDIAMLAPRRIVYVSCDPATLARDVKQLATLNYRLSKAVPLDLFPRLHMWKRLCFSNVKVDANEYSFGKFLGWLSCCYLVK
jgi:23S rRNA (uracil1939-C5)-methyltransferase